MDSVRKMDKMHNGKKDEFGVTDLYSNQSAVYQKTKTKKTNTFKFRSLDLFHLWSPHLKIGNRNTIYYTQCWWHQSRQCVRGLGISTWYIFS